MTYLAVSICGESISQFKARIAQALQAGAEMLELRVDYLADLSESAVKQLIEAVRQTKLPVIVTCRDKAEGGVGNWDTQLRTNILIGAIAAKADYIDCEFANFTGDTKTALLKSLKSQPHTRLILSAHQFSGLFDDLGMLYEAIRTTSPQAIPKLIYTAHHINDCFDAFDLLKNKDSDTIAFAMGPTGMISRVLAKKLGAFLTFAALDDQQTTAPGQLTVKAMKEVYRWDSINSDTELFGLIGDPVGHSMGPYIHNAGFTKQQVNALYLPFLVQNDNIGFNTFLDNCLSRPWMTFRGFSVTLPHKTNALDFTRVKGELVEGLASTIGAVNTLKIGFNRLVSAYNTDYAGAMEALTGTLGIERHQLHNMKVTVLGAGGVSRAVVAGLVDAGAEVTIFNRTANKAQAMAQEFGCHFSSMETVNDITADIVVNCTSIGMTPNTGVSPVPAGVFKPGMTAFDTVYSPLKTQFLLDAETAGCRLVNGAEMFIRQAMAQYRIFTGREPDENTMKNIVFSKLAGV